MGAYDCWCSQREKLRAELTAGTETANAAYRVRHAVAQVEQNTMAGQTDDLLRQQTGILFSCLKSSVDLLDVNVTTKVWVAQSQRQKQKKPYLVPLGVAALLQLFAGLLAYTKNLWVVWIAMAAALLCAAAGVALCLRRRKQEPQAEDQLKVTAQLDAEKLFHALDAQMQAIDRYINDFNYLNEQDRARQGAPDTQNLTVIAEMLEALYECEGDARPAAAEAAARLLSGMGMQAVDYAPQDSALFTVLPSKMETRTLVPAIVSAEDRRLLRRGVASVAQAA